MTAEEALERQTMRKVARRIVPFLIACYFIAYIDRTNIGFAALTMNADLGLSSTAFGLGGSLFFVAYVLFEVPSNLAQQKFGPRRWIARIMISWGLVGIAMAFMSGPISFYILRFLLGAAEAGFFPGAVLYLAQWFPKAYRARMVAAFMIAIPLSSVLGSPVSALLLSLEGAARLAGWQWLFLVEALPAIALGRLALFVLEDRPSDARWLEPSERQWLVGQLENERGSATVHHGSILKTLANGRVWTLALIYCGSSATSNALSVWQPQIIRSFGLTVWDTAIWNMIPFAVAAVFMLFWGRLADRTGERIFSTAVPLALTSLGLLGTMFTSALPAVMALLTIALVGNYAIKGPFWALAAETLPLGMAVAGLAAINAIAHVGTAGANAVLGVIHDRTGSYPMALIPLVILTGIGAIATITLGRSMRGTSTGNRNSPPLEPNFSEAD